MLDDAGLGPGGCAVWWARLTDARPQHVALLDPIERKRRAAYHRDVDRDRFTTGVALCRLVLGGHLGLRPRAVPIERGCASCGRAHGRPRLPGGAQPLFSVSHAGDLVAVAFTAGTAAGIGLDVEPTGAAVVDIERHVFSTAEWATVASLPATERKAAVLNAWVRKEAILKATGDGLTVAMNALSLTPLVGPADRLDWPGRPEASRIRLRDLAWPGSSYVACLAVLDPSPVSLVVDERDAGPLLTTC